MSKFDKNKVLPRYFAIGAVLTLICLAVVVKAGYTMTAKRSYWMVVANGQKSDSSSVKPARGNILSSDGQLLASSLPEYKIFMDFQYGGFEDTAWVHKRERVWLENLDSLCLGLHEIFPEWTAEQFRQRLEEGRHTKVENKKTGETTIGAQHWWVWPRRINYNTFCEVQKLPYFRLPKKYGFHHEKFEARRHPFGSLALRTIGYIHSVEGGHDTARCGIELSYDSVLRGKYGLVRKEKVLDTKVAFTVTPPLDGADVVTTIDVGMQDLAEQAVLEGLQKWNASIGVAILMEVKTGDVKAVVNMRRNADGSYSEQLNDAISYRCEPGSVFKVASFLVALDDGVIPGDTNFVIHTGCGVMPMHGAKMKDHNWYRGGYGDMNVAKALKVSSNIGVSVVIDSFYHKKPEKYVDGLYRVGIGEDLKLPIVGYAPPVFKDPRSKATDRAHYWSKTTLPWMSIGYETQVAPINTVTFYNAIANNGRMMRPRFVKQIVKDDEYVIDLPPEVIKEQIARPEAIETMQSILYKVVSEGLGNKAGSKSFHVSGKTGTAQVAKAGGYKNGVTEYWLSFCGYFPSENPEYTCIVCMRKASLPASGGAMSGAIFHKISEGVMAKRVKMDVKSARDTLSVFVPKVKQGDPTAANYVLGHLGINSNEVEPLEADFAENTMPSVIGMGASDAVYLIEQQGVRVSLHGTGSVCKQSVAPGTALKPDMTCVLELR